ncbi:MAG: phosphoribosyltransferase family protein [Sphingomonadales bacterium]|jgi:pyrimidine operon attenuation protein/uracil phosphoribosyltransferase
MQTILSQQQIQQKIVRLGHQLIETAFDQKEIYLGGIVGNGYLLAQQLANVIAENSSLKVICFEIKLNKDEPWSEPISFSIDQKALKNAYIVLIDDVVNSGKTMQYALLKFLEQATTAIKTVALIDRQHRRYPIKTDFAGLSLSTTLKNHVEVDFNATDAKVFLY